MDMQGLTSPEKERSLQETLTSWQVYLFFKLQKNLIKKHFDLTAYFGECITVFNLLYKALFSDVIFTEYGKH